MFYTKYRPQKFSDVCRPNEAADVLVTQLKNDKTAHAYLFVGPRGTGKTTLARLLAKALNCKKPAKNGDPCGECSSCEGITNGNFPDLIEIDAASNRGIDDIRELKDRIRLAPTMGKQKVYIIDEVHMLTTEAFNALLKTLEEPPAHTTFILCTTEFQKVPETIKSRCQVFRFRRATLNQLVEKLNLIIKEEKIKISKEELEKIALASLGGFRDAETLLQQVAEGELSIESLLSAGSKEKYIEFVEFLLNGNASDSLRILNNVYEEGFDLYIWVGELLKYFREILFIKSGANISDLDFTGEVLEDIKKQAGRIDIVWLSNAIKLFSEGHQSIKSSFLPQLPIEMSIVEICSLDGFKDYSFSINSVDNPNDTDINNRTKDEKDTKSGLKESVGRSDKSNKEGKNVSSASKESSVAVEKVKESWKEFLEKSTNLNHSITALLKSGSLIGVEENFLILEVGYKFHKERLESARNRKLIEGLLNEIFNKNLSIKCVLSKERPKRLKKRESGDLTDLNIQVPAGADRDALLSAFDGGLPL